ncbi:hypothetical protein E2P81_ATG04492 [Venturia nashicola]|nr:hypothetical protein E2P81_ATG04492 [Venturia nashicola]
MALSSQHIAKIDRSPNMATEIYAHQSTAIKLFGEALSNPKSEPVLDTLLLLIIFEISQSAHGMWSVHLNGARILLEQLSASDTMQTNLRMRGLVAMLVWWDVTTALISRREPILPLTYLDTLIQFPESEDWSFLVLVGCPVDFLMAMARLSKLAAIYEKTTRMEYTIFNDLPVQLIIGEVQMFINVDEVTFANLDNLEDEPGSRQNRFHCIEAWRRAVLLFAARAFSKQQDEYGLRKITYLARLVLDHVRCIPQDEFLQKQLLLPVFLAGSEVESQVDRAFVRQYCQHWNETSRFEHFGSAAQLLEDVWRDWHVSIRDVYWWGAKIQPQSAGRASSMVSEALFG